MNDPRPGRLGRANPIMVLAVGILVGALAVAVRQPGGTSIATGPTAGKAAGQAQGATATDATGASAAAGGAAAAPGAVAAVGGGDVRPGDAVVAGDATTTAATGGQAAACAGTPSKGVEGVTDTEITVGFGVPDLGALKALGDGVDPGDIPAHVKAILAGMRHDGLLPVCGRDIKPVFRSYDVLDPSKSRAACVGFADEDHVFAVVPNFGFSAIDCVANEKQRLLIDSGDSAFSANLASSPLLFILNPPQDVMMRNVAHWLVDNHLVDGKRVGVYYNESGPGGAAPPGAAVRAFLLDELSRLGHPADVVVTTNYNQLAGDPNDFVAVQRFKAEGVQVAIPLSSQTSFFPIAQSQGYKAQWVQWGVAMASDAVTAGYPAAEFDGALALLWAHVGEASVDIPPTPLAVKCMGWWNAAGGATPSRTAAEDQTIRETCDEIDVLVRGLSNAGAGLDHDSMVAGMEAVSTTDTAYWTPQLFGPSKHWGATQVVTQRYTAGCSCWQEQPPFRDLYSQ